MFNRVIKVVLVFFLACFIAWLSLGTQYLHAKYINIELIYLLTLFLLSVVYKHERALSFSKEDIFICLYAAFVTIGVFLCEDKDRAFAVYKAFIPVFILSYFSGKIVSQKNHGFLKFVMLALVLCIFFISLLGFIEIIFKKNILYLAYIRNPLQSMHLSEGRMMSFLMHPSVLGCYLAMCLPACFFMIEENKRGVIRILFILILIMGLLALFFTFSRGAWLAAIVSFFIFYWKRYKKLLVFLIVLFLVIFLLLAALSQSDSFIRQRFGLSGAIKGFSDEFRLRYISIMRKMSLEHPFFGIGLDHYRLFFNRYSSEKIVASIFRIPDNMYFAIVVETGFLSFVAYLFFIVLSLRKIFAGIKNKRGLKKDILVAMAAGLVAFMIKMATYDAFYWFMPVSLFGLYLGFCNGLIYNCKIVSHKDQ
jgi:O-antigen ligase